MDSDLIHSVEKLFKERFNNTPLLVFSPGRINIIGEHTDYNDGYVFPAAIDKGIVAAFEKSNSPSSTVYAIDREESIVFNTNTVAPRTENLWGNYILGVVKEIQKKGIVVENFNLVFSGNIPEGSGMSSSAALENCIVFGLNELFKMGLSKREMIFISQKAEHHFVGVQCGIMDQYASMFGIQDHALHLDCRTLSATPYKIDFEDYELLLINTNVTHRLNESAYNDRRNVCEMVSNILGVKSLRDAQVETLERIRGIISEVDYQMALFVIQEIQRTVEAANAMSENNLWALGDLIYSSHQGLQHQYKVSCEELDYLVDQTRDNPYILGARMMGGGFGGCTLNLIKSSAIEEFIKEVSEKYKEKFNRVCSIYTVALSDGTKRIETK